MARESDRSWFTLRFRALTALGIVAILLPGLGGFFGIRQARTALIAQIEKDRLFAARSLAAEIGHSLSFGVDFVKGAARRPGLSAAVARRDVAAARAVLVNIVGTTPLLRTAAVFSGPRQLLAQYPTAPSAPDPDLLSASASRVFAPFPSGQDAIMAVREPFIVGGRTVGFIVGEISFLKATPSITTVKFGDTGTATILDRSGRVLTSGEAKRVGGRVTVDELAPSIADLEETTARYFAPLVDVHEIGALAPVPGYQIGLLITVSEAEALGLIKRSMRVLIFGLLLLIGIGAAITVVVVQSFDRYERRLSERLKEQQRLNRALEGFSRHVAHDLRTPIAVIQLAGQTVEREATALSEGARKAAGMIERQAHRASELVEDLLDLARASGTPKIESFALEDVLDEAAHDMNTLDLRVQRPLPQVAGDRASIRQAIANLLQNASRYARVEGVAKVWVSAQQEPDGWVIEVADEGPGLPEGGDQQMFEPFTRGAARTSEQGSGLGLAIVAATAQAHGGRAWYEPRPEGGSIFRLSILTRREGDQAE